MKKVLLSALLVVLCVSAAFGGATEDLLEAVKGGATPQKIQILIKFGADVDAALRRSAWNNSNPEVIKTLLNAGAYINAKGGYGMTALMLAAGDNGNPEVIKALINGGASIYAEGYNGKTALDYAKSDEEKNLILNAARLRWATEDLLKAVQDKNATPKEIQALLNAGADVNAKDKDGYTVLMLAAGDNGNPEVIKLLLNGGADIYAKDNKGNTVLNYAKSDEEKNLIINATRLGGATWDLLKAVQDKNAPPQKIQALLNAGADVNAKDNGGTTALMLAARSNSNPEVIKTLLNAGAELFAKDNKGKTVLDHAKNDRVKELILNAAQ